MEAVIAHLREHYRIYVAVVAVLLPLVVIFRRYSVPAILYAAELCIYMAVIHSVLHGVVLLAGWFKDQSTMKRAHGVTEQSFNPGWDTPLKEFWNHDLYNPSWLFYLEIVLLVGVVVAMWRYRPLNVQRKRRSAEPSNRKAAAAYKNRTGGRR